MSEYECTPEYWDSVASGEPISKQGVPERYTQAQCLKAFELGLRQIPWHKTVIRFLKTDLWTEGVVRSREVLGHALDIAHKQRFIVEAYGIDISKEVCDRAMKLDYGAIADIRQRDIRDTGFPDNFFDLILDVSTIDHLRFSEAKKALAEYTRCLVSGGVLVLMFAHDSGRMDREGDHRIDYFPFNVAEVRRDLAGYSVKGEYAVHFLNIYPMSRPMALGMKLGFSRLIAWLFSWFEFTPFSKILKRYAPLYVIIGVKK